VQPIAVNPSEQLAVTARQSSSSAPTRALSWSQKSGYKVLPLPFWSWLTGYAQSEAVAIDDAGDVLGNLFNKNGGTHAAIWQAGKSIDIGTLAGY
jgi:uncharacterized membrane protein